MSETQQDQDRTYFTGDRENYKQLQAAFNTTAQHEQISPDGLALAYAIRAGLAEIAVEISSIRGFGVDQASRRKA
jgi:hypothetical protein